ncbi:MAG: DUF1127 domain-containing protein [Alphaproteobacteria bacterium]
MSNQCHDSAIGYASRRPARRVSLADRLLQVVQWLEQGLEVHRQRQALRSMDDHMLRDIGVTRADVERETRKPLWRR